VIGVLIILAHLTGDYVIQSDWMANEKTKHWWPAIAHGLTYTLPWLVVTRSAAALAVIAGTHIVIDRYRLARHVCWAKNLAAPAGYRYPWRECNVTGYHESRPPWMAVWLMILADNTMHLAIGAAAVMWL
jgi:hypothetical protein